MVSTLILIKHAQPVLDPAVPPREWRLGIEGEDQARRLARVLQPFMPFALVSSAEPKASRTADLVGEVLGIRAEVVEGLHEFDRPVLPMMSAAERERLNAAIFENPSRTVLGRESAARALERFTGATQAALVSTSGEETLVAVTHGTVISLFAAAHNRISAFDLWKRLQCPSFVVLTVPDYRIVRVEPNPLG